MLKYKQTELLALAKHMLVSWGSETLESIQFMKCLKYSSVKAWTH